MSATNNEESATSELPITLEFSGGVEALFDKKKTINVKLPLTTGTKWLIKDLLFWINDNLVKERPELFMRENSVRPGILVIINDTDWELLGTHNYQIQANDRIMFLSTLHGG